MNIEQIYLDLLSHFDTLPEPKMTRMSWLYRDGGVKDTIEKVHPRHFHPTTSDMEQKVMYIIRSCFNMGCFDDCTDEDFSMIEKWLFKHLHINKEA